VDFAFRFPTKILCSLKVSFYVYHIPSGLLLLLLLVVVVVVVVVIIIIIIIIAREIINSVRRSNVKCYTVSKISSAHKINTVQVLLYAQTFISIIHVDKVFNF
jgi:hypothetical protein